MDLARQQQVNILNEIMSTGELKSMCDNRGLLTAGTRADLCLRIVDFHEIKKREVYYKLRM